MCPYERMNCCDTCRSYRNYSTEELNRWLNNYISFWSNVVESYLVQMVELVHVIKWRS